jgi:3'-phosphoadenosine 5'-phosphosulfate sulfotransferase (PAPS reductase)/FAD synthetase
MASAIRAQERFNGKRTLVVTGERAQESTSRSKYNCFEPNRSDLRKGKSERLVDHHRPIHKWEEKDVWAIIKRHGVIAPPSYRLGWGRLSCLFCIFGNCNQWASAQAVDPQGFEAIAEEENASGQTIQRKKSARELANEGTPYPAVKDKSIIAEVNNPNWDGDILCNPSEWELPPGAYGEKTGPT